ncbi:MAG: 5-deoxy-glucuronate isomerase [Chloroflexota bacterium]
MTLLRRQRAAPGPDGKLVAITPTQAGWQYVHFAAYRLPRGAVLQGEAGGNETALIVLGGRCTIATGDRSFQDIGRRRDVWDRLPAYVLLRPPGSPYHLEAVTELHLPVAGAPATAAPPARPITPEEIVTEHRGEGQTFPDIHQPLPPVAAAERLLVVEVLTPSGNWSSFPPHKHDTKDLLHESYLEETYYDQIRPSAGFALQWVYTADRSLDEAVAPGDGDLVLVPRGYHTVAAMPGHECYYLNVMAGPGRAWNVQVGPAYAGLMNWRKPPVAGGSG